MKDKFKFLIIVGARPNFIKIAPLISEIKKYPSVQAIIVHTGQHYDYKMSKSFFGELNIPKPDYNLGVGSGSHAWQIAHVMEKIERIILKENPKWVVVVGDVNSTLSGALVAAKLHIPVAHIEAGLRSFDKKMPEEINRILTDHASNLLFCPTKTAIENLKKEAIIKGVYNVGDIMYDAFLNNIKIAQKKSEILEKLNLRPKEYFLLTIHRAKNADNPENLTGILKVLKNSGEEIIFPVHPRTKKQMESIGISDSCNIKLIEPVCYCDMLILERNAKKILTDSGGVQKEAYFAKVPCITLREETEWTETVKDGWNILTGTDEKKIINAIRHFNPAVRQKKNYGNGDAGRKIVKILLKADNEF